VSLSRKILSQKPPHHLPASITVFLLMSFLVFLAPKTAYPVDVTLTWSANTETDLAGYRIYHHEEGQAYDYNYPLWEGIDTTCTIYSLDDTTNHYFVARAFDIYWNESEDSVEVSLEASADTDGDGILDTDEINLYQTDPADTDTDGDGISDGEELAYWGSNLDTDYDGDGLNNLLDSDSDNDGMPDGAELREGFDPSDPTSKAELFPLQIGEVRVDHNWKHVAFSQTFQDPVVVVKSFSSYDGDPAVVRIQNIDATGFEIRIQEWDYLDGIHGEESVSYVAMERGLHTLPDGTLVEAQRLDTDVTNGFTQVNFTGSFPVTPVIIAAVSTYNGGDAVTTRTRDITAAGFQVGMEEQELNAQSHVTETISYIAWQPSSGTVDGLTFEVTTTSDMVTDNLSTIVYHETFLSLPVFIGDMQTTDGGDTANVRWQNQDLYAVDVRIAEEQSSDSEIGHTTEVVGYMLLSMGSDTDGDGTPDLIDNCPNDPNKNEAGICGCGLSDTDTDGDGAANCNDGCLDDPNKTVPGDCGCGVADTDSDGDGNPDCNESVNMPPTADAGPDQTVDEGSTVTLDGSNSWDDDGTIVSYDWTQIGGVAVTLSETWTAQPIFTAPDVGSEWILLTFQVTITDDGGLQSQDTCIVQVSPLNIEPPGSALYVSGVTIELRQMGRFRRSRWQSNYEARAYVVVMDEFGMLVSGASIRGDWTINGVSLNASFGTTNGAGQARLDSNKVKPESGDTFTLTVTEITKDGYTYDPSGNTHSITVP
jgi:hypothetical protein